MTQPVNLTPLSVRPPKEHQLMTKAKDLEVGFLSEMLGYAGFGKTDETFGGGIGEDQFSSFLRDAQARKMVERGGIGLAEHLFQALMKGQNDVA